MRPFCAHPVFTSFITYTRNDDAEYIKKNGGLDTETDYPYWSIGTICNPLREERYTACSWQLSFVGA